MCDPKPSLVPITLRAIRCASPWYSSRLIAFTDLRGKAESCRQHQERQRASLGDPTLLPFAAAAIVLRAPPF